MKKFVQLNWWKLVLCMMLFLHIHPSYSAPGSVMEESASVVVAQKLYKRLTGITIAPPDARLLQMASLIRQGQLTKAAAVATEDPYFYQTTVKNLAAELGSRNTTPYVGLDDFQATFIGTVADELDARGLLTGDYVYRAKGLSVEPSRANNQHYELIDQQHLQYKSVLVKQSPQWTGSEAMRNHAGLLTSRGFGWVYDAGTNRRAVLNSFERFLCRPIETWKIPGLNENTIGRDVDRAPGQNPKVFQRECRTCHGGLDPMRDAFASFDFANGALLELPEGGVHPKYERGALTYPEGHITTSDHWFNPIASRREDMGFKPELSSGKGVQSFGEMLANSAAFSNCMTEKVFRSVCARAAGPSDLDTVKLLSDHFEKNGYNLKKLFQEASVLPACLPTVGQSTASLQLRLHHPVTTLRLELTQKLNPQLKSERSTRLTARLKPCLAGFACSHRARSRKNHPKFNLVSCGCVWKTKRAIAQLLRPYFLSQKT
jgi:hypothetical protein